MKAGFPKNQERLTSAQLREIYGKAYFHGVSSGYPEAGYDSLDFDWSPWLDIIDNVHPGSLLLDIGCAYGPLVRLSGQRSRPAIGLDVSRFALGQDPTLKSTLVEGRATRLPFQASSVGVVCLFDVLEHLEDPQACLEDSVRVLGDDGLLVGATPDPLRFDRPEASHIYERPPSYWLAALRRLGLNARFRFSGQAYNFQFLAAAAGSATWDKLRRFQPGSFSAGPNFISTEGPIEVVARDGWLSVEPAQSRLDGKAAGLYLHNPCSHPLQLSIRLELEASPAFSTLTLRLGSLVLGQLHLTTEQSHYSLKVDAVPIAAGGHALWIEIEPGGPAVNITRFSVESTEMEPWQLASGLPFDLFQRYQLGSRVLEILGPASILDVGGVLGDRDGHLAVPADFLTSSRLVVSTDLRHSDQPHHEIADAARQPFPDESFDAVLSLDVLEHLKQNKRRGFVEELCRVARQWVVLAAPINLPEVEAAEKQLSDGLLAGHGFLEEHAELGLPDPDEVHGWFGTLGWTVLELPNGYLPNWLMAQSMTQLVFGCRDLSIWRAFNQLYNEHASPTDQRHPAYRRFWIAARSPFDSEIAATLGTLAGNAPPAGQETAVVTDPRFSSLLMRWQQLGRGRAKALLDAQFIANERSEGLDLLRKELEETPLSRMALRRLRQKRR